MMGRLGLLGQLLGRATVRGDTCCVIALGGIVVHVPWDCHGVAMGRHGVTIGLPASGPPFGPTGAAGSGRAAPRRSAPAMYGTMYGTMMMG